MVDKSFSRRAFLKKTGAMGLAALAPAALAACGRGDNGGGASNATTQEVDWPELTSKEVVFATFGGLTYEVIREVSLDPFTDLTGVKVVEAPWDYGKFIAMLDSKNPEWDMIDFDGFSIAGLVDSGAGLAKLEPWVRRCDLVDPEYRDYAAGAYSYSVTLGWTDELEEAPTNWEALFDVEKFPGKRAFPKSIYAGTVEIALLADGVPKDKIYPLDFDRAFKKLSTIKEHLLFFDSLAQGQQFMTQRSATMFVGPNSRCEQLKSQGGFDYTFQDAILYPWGGFPMPANLPHPDTANALIHWMSAPERQAEIARRLQLGPIVSDAFEMLSDEELAKTPNSPQNRELALTVDTKQAAKQDAEYAKRYADWVAA